MRPPPPAAAPRARSEAGARRAGPAASTADFLHLDEPPVSRLDHHQRLGARNAEGIRAVMLAKGHCDAAAVIEHDFRRFDVHPDLARFGDARLALGFPTAAGLAIGCLEVGRVMREIARYIVFRP